MPAYSNTPPLLHLLLAESRPSLGGVSAPFGQTWQMAAIHSTKRGETSLALAHRGLDICHEQEGVQKIRHTLPSCLLREYIRPYCLGTSKNASSSFCRWFSDLFSSTDIRTRTLLIYQRHSC